MDRALATRFSVPRPARRPIGRPHVSGVLARASDARLVLVSAPPGFGKSTALAEWLGSTGWPGAWIQLEESDNDPVRFVRALGLAAAALESGIDTPPASAPATDVLDGVHAIADRLDPGDVDRVLVLDDYHLITEPAVHRATALLLELLPAAVHLAIATRSDPPLPLARLRARGQLLEVRADDLRFTVDEASEFLDERLGVALSRPDVAGLVERTEGWPAVMQLAVAALAGRPDAAERARDFAATHRFVLDYIVEEVLAGLDPGTASFLLRTSILDRLGGPVCDAVTGDADGQARLEALERANLLIVPLDEERRWYRYHALFAEVLRARLRIERPDEVAGLHARASAWFAAEGWDDEAVGHGLRAGDLDRVIRIVSEASLRRLNAGEIGTVRRWLDALPPDVVRREGQLSASYGWCLALLGIVEGLSGRIDDAEEGMRQGRDGGPFCAPMLPVQIALLRSRLADFSGDPVTAVEEARRAADLVPDGLPPVADATMRGDVAVLLARALLSAGDVDGAVVAYEASLPYLRAGRNLFALGRAIADLAGLAIQRGDPEAAVAICEAEERQVPSSAQTGGAVLAALARAHAELGHRDQARDLAQRAIELGTRSGDRLSVSMARRTLDALAAGAQVAASTTPSAPDRAPGPEALTPRELEVLCLVGAGRSNSQVARELFVTVGTVKSHLHTISGKLGATNRTEAVALARTRGLID